MTIHDVPAAVRPAVRRLARRLAVGLFFDIWPRWAVASLLTAGCAALAVRLFVPAASAYLPWLWLAPLLSVIPALVICIARRYRPADVVALADSLSGGQGVLLTMVERHDPGWAEGPWLRRVSGVALPRVHAWRRLAGLPPALLFLLAALMLPQRLPALDTVPLADEIAADLAASVAALREQDLITPVEEARLEEEIARVREAARERMDASAWEAADALRERLAASVAARQDAAAWAQDALARYAAAAADGLDPAGDASAAALATEVSQALEALANSGLLAGAPTEWQGLLGAGGQLPADPEALRQLAAALSEHLAEWNGRFGDMAALGQGGGRFDPSEFALAESPGPDGAGLPGIGGINRGRGDATLTWGDESLPADRFRAEALPPGRAGNPDDWSPVITLPAAPDVAPERSASSAARTYTDEAGAAAWRRTLMPRHLSAIRRYFER